MSYIMKWEKGDKYYIKGKMGDLSFTISKSMIYDKVIYELWNGTKWLYKSNDVEDAKQYATQVAKDNV